MKVLGVLVLLLVCACARPASADEWRWPLDGVPAVTRPFAAPVHRYAAGHRGADLPGSPGAAVRAAGAGVVSYAGLLAGRGVVVVVHGPLRTTYEPVRAAVDVAARVSAGDVVGVLEPGHAGCPVPACLHWGLRRGDAYLDPVRLVQPGPVRLLPLDGPAPVAAPPPWSAAAPVRPAARGPDRDEPRVLAPAEVPRSTDAFLAATAAASALGAAAAVITARRRRTR